MRYHSGFLQEVNFKFTSKKLHNNNIVSNSELGNPVLDASSLYRDDPFGNSVQPTLDGHGDADVAALFNYLGILSWRRFERTGNLEDISNAMQDQQRAVQLTPDGHPNLPTWLNNLGNSFSSRFARTGDLEDISSAIRNQQRAVQLTPDGLANLPTRLSNLGISFLRRFRHTGDLETWRTFRTQSK